jgi:hypothetical protein
MALMTDMAECSLIEAIRRKEAIEEGEKQTRT